MKIGISQTMVGLIKRKEVWKEALNEANE